MFRLSPQQQQLFERLAKDRQQNAEVIEKLSMKGIKNRVVDNYSEPAHFIYELLQNADDAKASEARFILKQSGIIFAHNGCVHFSLTDPSTEVEDTQKKRLGHLNAITSIGNSNKYEAQIGKFGIGFKAVFQYTTSPEIYDSAFFFKIERFIVPILLLADHPDRKPDETLFYFPFNNPQSPPLQAFQTILAKLKNLVNPLLFLNHLTKLSWFCDNNQQGYYLKTIRPKPSYPNSHCQVEIVITQKKLNLELMTNHFLVLNQSVSSYSIRIAYLIEFSQKQVVSQQKFPAYCFFATQETTHLRFIIQAPFLLTDNREGIKRDEIWNRHLIDMLAQLTAESLSIIKQIGLLTEDFFEVLPIDEFDFPVGHLFRPIYDAVLMRLQSHEAFLPTTTGHYTVKDQAYLAARPRLMNLLGSEQLSQLFNNNYSQWIFPKTTAKIKKNLWEYVKQNLINDELTTDKFIKRITRKFIHNQSDNWLIQLYIYLLEQWPILDENKRDLLRTKPILRLNNGQIVSAYNRAGKIQVYLPTDNNSEYPTIKFCFVKHNQSLQFLLALGLEKPSEYQEIQYYILPRYKKSGSIDLTIMRRDFNKLFTYFLKCPGNQKSEYLNQLKHTPFCRAHELANNTATRAIPSVIYFKTEPLKNYFYYYQPIYFLDTHFYADFYKKFGTEPLNSFFQALGVEDKPRRIKIKAVLSRQEREAIHQGQCTHDYYHSFQHTYDYDLEGLDVFLAHINLKNSKILWHFLLKLIENYSEAEIFKGQYNWFYRRNRYYFFDAKCLVSLRQSTWLYNRNGDCVKPVDIATEELIVNYDTDSYAAKILIGKLEIRPEISPNSTTEEQKYKYRFGDELVKLATTVGKEPTEVLNQLKYFLLGENNFTASDFRDRGSDFENFENLTVINEKEKSTEIIKKNKFC